jgi:hypothetical protein
MSFTPTYNKSFKLMDKWGCLAIVNSICLVPVELCGPPPSPAAVHCRDAPRRVTSPTIQDIVYWFATRLGLGQRQRAMRRFPQGSNRDGHNI